MRFNSIAVIDCETTSLSNARLTELCVVACNREHCDNSGDMPRVLHKFSICVNPGVKIHPFTTDLTGLDNDMLAEVNSFDENAVESLRLFLARLPQPTVLVAHNGLRFDFPLLKKEITIINSKMLNVYCADSLPGFRKILSNIGKRHPLKGPPELEDDPEGDKLCSMAMDLCESPLLSQEINESTPDRRQKILLKAPKKPLIQKVFNAHDTARRTLFHTPHKTTEAVSSFLDDSDNSAIFSLRGKPKSYQLLDVFEYFYGYRPLGAHRAENDAITLLQCILKIPDTFCDFLDSTAIPLESV